ncbi:transposase [Pseudoalteromonas tunicata]|nr:transposase [Pseudoalteromonas tunicata]
MLSNCGDSSGPDPIYYDLTPSITVVEAAASLNITDKLLYNWVAKFKQQNEDSELSKDDRAELVQLRKDNKRLLMEREILKKASAFFAKEMK